MLKIKTLRKYFWKITLIAIFIFFTAPSAVFASTIFRAPSIDGLVGYWDLNDGAGSTMAKDKSGQGHNGTLTLMDPATDWVDGKVGSGALDFDGSNDYVDMGSQPDLRFNSGNFTITGWLKPNVVTGTRTLAANYIDPNLGYFFGIFSSKIGYYSNAWKSANTTLSTGIWYHIAITVDSSGNYIFYLNGVADGSGASTLPAANEDTFKIGAYGGSGGLGIFNGLIDDVRIYNRALSAEEITNLYNSQKKSFPTTVKSPLSNGLVGYWNFDIGAGGSAVYDMSGQANNGTMVNMDPATDWVDGKVGSGALDFDGSNDHINIPDSSNWDLFGSNTGGATLSLWVKHNSWNTTDAYIAHRQDDSNAWWIQHEAGGTMWFGIYTTAGFIVQTPAGGAITNTNWHHITLVKNENVYTLSLDGIVAGTVTDDSTAVFTGPLFIGDITSIPAMSPVYPFDGLIDDVRVYNRALSAEEIQRLYKITAGTKINKLPFLSKGLVGYWDLNDGAGSTMAKDKSGQGHNGTLTLMDPATDWVDGKVGSGALDFDGSNDYVDIVNNSLFENMISNANVNKTLAIWFNADTLVAESVEHLHPSLMNKGNVYMNFGVDDSGELAFMWYNVSAVTQRLLTSGAGISTGSWYHGAVVLNEGIITLYVNGVNKGSGTFTGIQAGATGGLEWFGTTGGAQGTQRWDGKMDEVRIYNRALSAEEIQRLYDIGNLKP